MARRPFEDEPMSQIAAWSGRFAWFALAVAAMSVIILRSGLLEIVPALATFAAALGFAGLAVLLALVSFVVIWRTGKAGLGRAVLGLFVGAALLAYPAYLGNRALKLPAIHDITTDPANPPRFETLARQRPSGNIYPADSAQKQRAGYPDIAPLQFTAPPKQVFDIAMVLVTKRKWQIADSRPPGPGRRDGAIEAVSRTPIMGFRDDVAIRITPLGQGTRVDMRSASRYAFHDFGANAARLRALLEDLDDAVSAAPEPRPEPEKKPEPKRPEKRQPAKR